MKPVNILLSVIFLVAGLEATSQSGYLNIKKFNAKADNTTINTKAIQNAVDACYAAGGGTVVVPAGTWLTGCIVLKSNVNLHLEPGAVLLGSTDKDDYKVIVPEFESRTNDLYVNRSIIYAEKADNISVTGTGIINGNGKHQKFSKTLPQKNRPFLARFVNCTNLTIRDVSMIESANWTCHLLGCKDVLIDGLKISNSVRANRDGLDIDGCENMTVSNCRIHSQDDAIVFKTTGPAPVKNVTVTNCIVSSHASGIKFGTETTGDFENIAVSNCVIKDIPVYSGLSLMIVDGGTMRNISINNIVMDSVNIPVMIRLGNRARPYKNGIPTPDAGYVENIFISDVTARNAGQTCHITGLRNRHIKNVSLNNINIHFNREFTAEPLGYNEVPVKDTGYPSGQLYGSALPASAFYFRDVDELFLNNINLHFGKKDTRIPIVIDNIHTAQLNNIKTFKKDTFPKFYIRNSKNVTVLNNNLLFKAVPVVITENNSKNITIFPEGKPGFTAIETIAALPDKTYDDIKGYSEYMFTGKNVKNLECNQPHKNKTIALKTEKGKIFKLLFLSRSEQPETISLKINKKDYTLKVSNSDWQWNVINVQEVSKNGMAKISFGSNGKDVCIAKIVLIPLSETD